MGGPKRSQRQSVCPTIEVKPWDELLKSVSPNLRGSARKALRRMEEDGVRREPVESADAEDAAGRLVALHRGMWEGRGISREHTTREFEEHMRRALPRMVARGLGTVYEFRRGEEAITSSFCNYGRDSVGGHLYGATQEALRRYQVSSLLVWDGLSIARDRGCAHLDLLRGDEPYKLRWNPKMVPNQRVILGREGLPFGFYAGYRRLRAAARGYAGSEDTPPLVQNDPRPAEGRPIGGNIRAQFREQPFHAIGRIGSRRGLAAARFPPRPPEFLGLVHQREQVFQIHLLELPPSPGQADPRRCVGAELDPGRPPVVGAGVRPVREDDPGGQALDPRPERGRLEDRDPEVGP